MNAPLTKTQTRNLDFLKKFVKLEKRFPTVSEHANGVINGKRVTPKIALSTAQYHRENLVNLKKINRLYCRFSHRTYFELST